ncbi:ABC transporter substrate-binding protein [Pararhodobacter sp.]|uniref:ABC transporter substrate-binding protein n=1 Tax=Pararhodobacter sp. TaxID=2127056 RepID=UPI002AFED807|nr:ABC transporter substrate-binding protein [Pararhodobacter sp.]
MNKRLLGFVAAAGLTLSGLMAQAQTAVTYLFPAPDFLPAFAPFQLALGKGYYAEAGLDVTFRVGNGGADVATQVAVGNADMGGGMGDTALIVRANGLDIRGVALLGGQGITQIAWRSDRGINGVADLRGRSIGVIGFQDTTYYNLLAVLSSADLGRSDVDIQALGPGGIIQNMIGGSIDAMAGVPEWIAAIEAAGIPLTVTPARNFFASQAQAIIASDTFIAEHPEVVRGFVTATLRAIHEIIADPATAAQEYVGFVPRHAEDVAQIEQIMRMYVTNVYAQDGDRPIGAFDPEQLQIAEDFYVANELVTAAVPVADAYTNDFIE